MARPRKLNIQKQGHRTKEELQEAENVENGLYEFDQINAENLPEDLTEGAAKEWGVLFLFYNNYQLQN